MNHYLKHDTHFFPLQLKTSKEQSSKLDFHMLENKKDIVSDKSQSKLLSNLMWAVLKIFEGTLGI